jgi:CRISPR-associated protein Csc1
MHIYRLFLTLQDPLYFATRELGRLYVTERYLHNYALSYALGLALSSYHDMEHIPHYEEDLAPLNYQTIYVTPARPVDADYVTHTYKWANLDYHVEMQQISKNIPTYGRIRELAPESTFEAFLISAESFKPPGWIRLGKWMSKAKVNVQEFTDFDKITKDFICEHPLNPLDVIFANQVISYDTLNMPPVSLIRNVRFLSGQHYRIKDGKETICLPANMEYRFSG